MAALALSSFLLATYTLAFFANNAYANSHVRDKGAVNNSFEPGDKRVI